MTEKEKISAEKETYRIAPESPGMPGMILKGPGGNIMFSRGDGGKVECMVKRFHWLVGSPDGNRYDIDRVDGDGLVELDQLQTSFSAYPNDYSLGFESDIKSLRRRCEYRKMDGMPSMSSVNAAFAVDPRSGVVLLGRALRNSLAAIACSDPACHLNEPVLRTLIASGCVSAEEAEAVETVLDYSDVAARIIRFELPDQDVIAWWLRIYGKVASRAVSSRFPQKMITPDVNSNEESDMTTIIMCNGIDDSIKLADIDSFSFHTASNSDRGDSPKGSVRYVYGGAPDESLSTPSMYDFLAHLLPPQSSSWSLYCVPRGSDGEENRFTYFVYDGPEAEASAMAGCLIDCIRLFKFSRAGFGTMAYIPDESSMGTNDLRDMEAYRDLFLMRGIPDFSLKDGTEAEEFMQLYRRFRNWRFNTKGDDDKYKLVDGLISLYRQAFRSSDKQSAYIMNAVIWETYAEAFPSKRSGRFKTGYAIKRYVNDLIRNGPSTKEKTSENYFNLMECLYWYRSEFAHGSGKVPEICIRYAFEVSRCIILKLLWSDDSLQSIVTTVHSMNEGPAPYRNLLVTMPKIDEEMMGRIEFVKEQIKQFNENQEIRAQKRERNKNNKRRK